MKIFSLRMTSLEEYEICQKRVRSIESAVQLTIYKDSIIFREFCISIQDGLDFEHIIGGFLHLTLIIYVLHNQQWSNPQN
jgi:hypothetical protein